MASAKQKRKKFVRTISGKARVFKAGKKTAKRKCALCKKPLCGTPHGKTKVELQRLSKSEKRPSVIFAGLLCSNCRRQVIDEAIMVRQKSKSLQQVDLSLQGFVQKAVEWIE